MAITRLDEADKAELLEIARKNNFEVDARWGADTLRAKLVELGVPAEFEAPDDDLPIPGSGKKSREVAEGDKRAGYATATITIAMQHGEPEDVPVIVEGDTYLVKRGMKVTVPRCVFEALENAKRIDYAPSGDGSDSALKDPRESYRFPFVVHSKQ